MATLALVLLGGAAGAVVRYLVSRALLGRLPWGTLTVNLAGAGLLGFLVGLGGHLPTWLLALLGTGLCGALTTWSTLAVELAELPRRRAIPYGAITILGGLAVAALTWQLGAASIS
ncbi:CrcB protein [Allocatelliglobosispora scoriae]|uniref:Fluoride-specific ion channel FluC n=1 Tax=Allocatelliglobosispora scoriae TaxID=643052 RepID=A0A841BTE6_9ACTN|nr:CrcB family protein [Allocatelliglobosispora scoriae]MBB5870975.1 CrcB protein [Allocatelliglobosispora scoriae]